ncbi:hypothetical protein ACHOLT_11730 [Desulfitobacterium sp. Sab5]|uniref:hypothetical protein n=1 Tax=Desulfitobacterium nosdiversum TaxID=3375356 RepID=UPI003CED4C14
MEVLVPIENFVIEKKFELGGISFFPANKFDFSKMKAEQSLLEDFYSEGTINCLSLRDAQSMASGVTIEDILNVTLAKIWLEWPDNGYSENSREDDEILILKACEKVDRVMDFIRVMFCRMDLTVMNPGLAGLLHNGFSVVVLTAPQDNSYYRIAASRFYGLSMVNGLGLELDSDQIEDLCNETDFSIIFNCSGDYSSELCKTALRRLSEAMYIPNIDSKFIYLMTTLETVASPDYMGFKKVKSRILPFIANSKKEYFTLADELQSFSEDIRTEIVHNGKSLTDIRNNEYKKILLRLQSYVTNFVLGVQRSNCSTNEDIEAFRIAKLRQLGIN